MTFSRTGLREREQGERRGGGGGEREEGWEREKKK